MFRKQQQMKTSIYDNCHDGEGRLSCRLVLEQGDSELGIQFMHDDILEPAAIIGEHLHDITEELYFVVEGTGTMILDGKKIPTGTGDVCLVKRGHSHGIINSPDKPMRLLVFSVKQ